MGKTNSSTINDHKNMTKSYSFGVGRENMAKVHVDKILKNVNGHTNVPGSGTYEYRQGFGSKSHSNTPNFSIRKKLNVDELLLEKSKKFPGPGYYNTPDCIASRIADSTKTSAKCHSVSKARDRFRIGNFNVPGPNAYAPRDELNNNFNSVRRYRGSTSIGRERLRFTDTEWKNGDIMKEKAKGPGPGSYARFSDFNGLEKVELKN